MYKYLAYLIYYMVSRRAVIGGVGAVVIGGIVAGGATGLVPGVSGLMGTNRPRDLGVRYTDADYESGLQKIPGHSVTNPEYMCVTCDYVSEGSVPADATFTQEEFTAQVNTLNAEKGPVSDAQVRFNEDGTLETSAAVADSRFSGPVYAKGRIADYSPRSVRVEVEDAEVGRIGMDDARRTEVSNLVNRFIGDFFTKNPGLSVEELGVESGGVKFKGTFPETMIGDPNVEPDSVL